MITARPQVLFAAVPLPLLEAAPTPSVQAVASAIVARAQGGYRSCPTLAEICKLAKVCRRTASDAIAWLFANDWMEEEPDPSVTARRWFNFRWERRPPRYPLFPEERTATTVGAAHLVRGPLAPDATPPAHLMRGPHIESLGEMELDVPPLTPQELAEALPDPETQSNRNGNDQLPHPGEPEAAPVTVAELPEVPGWTVEEPVTSQPTIAPEERQVPPVASVPAFAPTAEEIAGWERDKGLEGYRGTKARIGLATLHAQQREALERQSEPSPPKVAPAPAEPFSTAERSRTEDTTVAVGPLPPRVARDPSAPLQRAAGMIRSLSTPEGSPKAVASFLARRWRDGRTETLTFLEGFFGEVARGTLTPDHALGLVQDADREQIRDPARYFGKHGGEALRRAKKPPHGSSAKKPRTAAE